MISQLQASWQQILEIDYEAIFRIATEILKKFNDNDHHHRRVIKGLVNLALNVCQENEFHFSHDLLGRVLNPLIYTAKNHGSFYTSISAAELLSQLSLANFTNPDQIKIIDPACGTGTLLMAVANQIINQSAGVDREPTTTNLIENLLYGVDINPNACHFTAVTLGLLSPKTAFSKMRIYQAPLGVDPVSQTAHLGSLELLDQYHLRLPSFQDQRSFQQVEKLTAIDNIENHQFDLVIMNPPYTRSNLSYKDTDGRTELALRQRRRAISKRLARQDVWATSGSSLGTMFIDLAERLLSLKPNSTLACVYPASGARAPSALNFRKMLGHHFLVEWVVFAKDSQRDCFSENTHIGEILIVARRINQPTNQSTKFVCLFKNHNQLNWAQTLADQLLSGQTSNLNFTVGYWPAEQMRAGNWRPLSWASERLVEILQNLTEGSILPTQAGLRDHLLAFKASGIKHHFQLADRTDRLGYQSLTTNSTELVVSLGVEPNKYLHPKTKRAEEYFQAHCSRLLLTADIRLNTTKVVCCLTSQDVISSRWFALRYISTGNIRRSKALCLWFNSSLGILSLVGLSSPRLMERVFLNDQTLDDLIIPNFNANQCNILASFYDANSNLKLLELALITKDSVRIAIDQVIGDSLGLDNNLLATVRSEISKEPATELSNKRRRLNRQTHFKI